MSLLLVMVLIVPAHLLAWLALSTRLATEPKVFTTASVDCKPKRVSMLFVRYVQFILSTDS